MGLTQREVEKKSRKLQGLHSTSYETIKEEASSGSSKHVHVQAEEASVLPQLSASGGVPCLDKENSEWPWVDKARFMMEGQDTHSQARRESLQDPEYKYLVKCDEITIY